VTQAKLLQLVVTVLSATSCRAATDNISGQFSLRVSVIISCKHVFSKTKLIYGSLQHLQQTLLKQDPRN